MGHDSLEHLYVPITRVTYCTFMTIIFNSLLGKSLISVLLSWFLDIYLVSLFEIYFLVSSLFLILCLGLCALNKTATSPSLDILGSHI